MQPFPDPLHTSRPLVERVCRQRCMMNGGSGDRVDTYIHKTLLNLMTKRITVTIKVNATILS